MLQLHADCALLEELKVMDYSLLLGVHVRSNREGYSSAVPTDREVRRCWWQGSVAMPQCS